MDGSDEGFFEVGEGRRQPAKLVRSEPRKQPQAARRIGPAPQIGYVDRRTVYEIAPAQDLPRDTRFAVALDGEARGAQGDLPAGKEWRQECRTLGPMKVSRISRCFQDGEHCSQGPLSIGFSNPLASPADLKARVHVEPEAQIAWDEVELQEYGTRAILFGKLKPGTSYVVAIEAGIKDVLGQEAPATRSTVQMDDLLPSLYAGAGEALLESSGDGQLPVQVTNLERLEADLWALTPSEAACFMLGSFRVP